MKSMHGAVFSSIMSPLSYNPMDIEHPMYMFDHRLVGCVVLKCDQKLDSSKMGEVLLDGKRISGSFFFEFSNQDVRGIKLFAIPIRGRVDYGKQYQILLRNFYMENGERAEAVELTLSCQEKRLITPEETKKYQKHDRIALQAAAEGIVLLRNEDQTLPLPQGSILNLFGSGVTNFRCSAVGAGRISPREMPTIREALQRYTGFSLNSELDAFYAVPNDEVPAEDILIRSRLKNDTAIMFITRGTGENIDNQPIPGEYYLTEQERVLMDKLCDSFAKVVVILNTGYPIELKWMNRPQIKGILYTGLAGQAGAEALCRILEGSINPSAKLPDTWSYDYYDIPSSQNFYHPKENEKPVLADDAMWADTCYEEGIYIGYRYFESFHKEAAFYFGHGLSYTTFEREVCEKTNQGVTVRITNKGKKAGQEVVMLYLSVPGKLSRQPDKVLVSFEKTKLLEPGESEEIRLQITPKKMAVYVEERNAWIKEAGEYRFYLGGSVHEAVECGKRYEKQETVVQQLQFRLPPPMPIAEISPDGKQWPEKTYSGIYPERKELFYRADCSMARKENGEECRRILSINSAGKKENRITYKDVVKEPRRAEAFVEQFTDKELCRLIVMFGSGWGMENKGEAGRLAPLEDYDLPVYACADGNCGVNLNAPNIGMPTSVVLCATFNKKLAFEVGKAIGEEALEHGIRMILATAMNIHRNPLCGRHAEYFSEDPLLAGEMAGMQIKGLHAAGVADSVKHVACNNCETARKRNHSIVGEKAFREIYLRAYEYLIDMEMPDTIMTGYNALNGCMCGENEILLEGIFRKEFGFDGFAMTDWNSYDTVDMVKAVNAGISWLTPGENDDSRVLVLLKAVRSGKLARQTLIRNVERMIRVFARREPK